MTAQLVRAVSIQRADDEAAVLLGAPVGRAILLSVGVSGSLDHRMPALFIPRSEGSAAFAQAAVGGENVGREARPVDGDAARSDAVRVVRINPCAQWRFAIIIRSLSAYGLSECDELVGLVGLTRPIEGANVNVS